MVTCGLVKVSKSKGKLLLTIPHLSVNNRYSWAAFRAEFHLLEVEITKSFINEYGGHIYCIKVGRFTTGAFNPVEQFWQKRKLPKLLHLEPLQRGLVVSLAPILPQKNLKRWKSWRWHRKLPQHYSSYCNIQLCENEIIFTSLKCLNYISNLNR